jgi:hypothetical protein
MMHDDRRRNVDKFLGVDMGLILQTEAWLRQQPKIQRALKSDLFGDPALANRTQLIAYVQKTHVWAQRSVTAQAILAVVQNARQNVYFVGMRNGGYSCFDSDCPVEGEGTIYLDLDTPLKVQIRDGVDPKTRDPKYKADLKEMDPFIAFLHELGHAKQWIENPSFFGAKATDFKRATSGQYIGTPKGTDTPEKLARVLPEGKLMRETATFNNELTAAASLIAGRAQNARSAAPGKLTDGQARTLGQKALMLKENTRGKEVRQTLGREPIPERQTAPAWGVRIETDNLVKHEWPICRELHWPEAHLRHYTDIKMG